MNGSPFRTIVKKWTGSSLSIGLGLPRPEWPVWRRAPRRTRIAFLCSLTTRVIVRKSSRTFPSDLLYAPFVAPRLRPVQLRRRSPPQATSAGHLARSQFQTYRDRFSSVEGWFTDEAQATWDFLLAAQSGQAISGGFMEIGVWRGKSAFMGALHVQPADPVVLVDISDATDVAEKIRAFHPKNVVTVTGRSSLFRGNPAYERYRATMRFFHVDGGHSGFGPTRTSSSAPRWPAIGYPS